MDKAQMAAEDWFKRAEEFWLAGVLMEVHDKRLSHPNVTCRAFAAEAYLKCLLTLREKRYPGDHNLRNLFKLLPTKDKRQIEELWNSRTLPNLLKARSTAPSQFNIGSTLMQTLKQSGDAFKDWRYKFKGQSHWVIGSFPREVRRVILEARPEWEESPPSLHLPKASFRIAEQSQGLATAFTDEPDSKY